MKYATLNNLLSPEDIMRFGQDTIEDTELSEGKIKSLFDNKALYKEYDNHLKANLYKFLEKYPKLDLFRNQLKIDFGLSIILKATDNEQFRVRNVEGIIAFLIENYWSKRYPDLGKQWLEYLGDDVTKINDESLDLILENLTSIHNGIKQQIQQVETKFDGMPIYNEEITAALREARLDSKMMRYLLKELKNIVHEYGAEEDEKNIFLSLVDTDKLELYFADRATYYVVYTDDETNEQNRIEALHFLEKYFLVTEYIAEQSGKPYVAKLAYNGKIITYQDLKEILKAYYMLNKEFFDKNATGITIDEILNTQLLDARKKIRKAEVEKHLQANWDLVPYGKGDKKIPSTWTVAKKEIDTKDERLAKDYALLSEKEEFYSSTTPKYIIDGRNAYAGYGGFIYENGLIVLEKFKIEKGKKRKIVPVHDEGFVIMKAHDFLEMSRYSKTELMELIRLGLNKSAQRKYHSKNWKENLSLLINAKDKDYDVDIIEEVVEGILEATIEEEKNLAKQYVMGGQI